MQKPASFQQPIPMNILRSRPACFMLVALLVALGIGGQVTTCGQDKPAGPEKWEKDIAKFEAADRESPPVKQGVLFIGSSSIRKWDLEHSFPKKGYINRGFGGSQIVDSTHFAGRILLPYQPRIVVLYAGDNDIASGKSPEQVFADYKAFVQQVHDNLPETRIAFIAIKPSLKRWNLIDKIRAANKSITEFANADRRLSFVDVDKPMLGDDGRPRESLFVEDGLHLSAAGYELWTSLVEPHLQETKQ